jgi:hypothetical protein
MKLAQSPEINHYRLKYFVKQVGNGRFAASGRAADKK